MAIGSVKERRDLVEIENWGPTLRIKGSVDLIGVEKKRWSFFLNFVGGA